MIKRNCLWYNDLSFSVDWCSEEGVVLSVLARLDIKVSINFVLSVFTVVNWISAYPLK